MSIRITVPLATCASALIAEERLRVAREVVELVGGHGDDHAINQHSEGRCELEQYVPQPDACKRGI